MNKTVIAMLLAVIPLCMSADEAPDGSIIPFLNSARASRIINIDVHAGAGNSFVTQNYESTIENISDMNLGSGWSFMGGLKCELAVRDYLWIGTECNLLINNYTADFIVHPENSAGVSNIFVKNHYYYLNFPVFASFKLNIASTVRWNVDAGVYYSYGLAGDQRQTIYNAVVNDIGQLISSSYTLKTDYFNDDRSFINSAHRSDIGLHLATGLTFSRHISVGMRAQIGFKNIANTVGIHRPNLHNISFMGTLGYNF